MIGPLTLVLAGLSVAYGATFNVTVGADSKLLYNPEFVMAGVGDTVNFIFFPKNHSATQSSFDAPCTPLQGGTDAGFNPVAPDSTAPNPVFQVTVQQTETPIWFHCKQPVGNHCGTGMVFAINPPPDSSERSFAAFKARAQATLATSTAPDSFSTPPPQPWESATATVTLGQSVWTTTYSSYLGAAAPTPAAQPIDHRVIVGPDGTFTYSPANFSASVGDTVTFEFRQKNHTVTQSSFSNPCQPLAASGGPIGFSSGFRPVAPDVTSDFPTFQITINDTAPIWGYCGQTGHCAAGMVFGINAVETGPNNFGVFTEIARRTANSTTTAPNTSPTAPAPAATNSNGAAGSSPTVAWTLGSFALVAMLL